MSSRSSAWPESRRTGVVLELPGNIIVERSFRKTEVFVHRHWPPIAFCQRNRLQAVEIIINAFVSLFRMAARRLFPFPELGSRFRLKVD